MMFCLNVCLFTKCASGVHGGQKRASDHLDLELQKVVSHDMGAGTRTQVLWKNSQSS